MDFFLARKINNLSFSEATERVREALKREGFGVITEIDLQKTLKEKINVDFRKYLILGACNPYFAHRALLAEDKIGVLLPCNVVIQETHDRQLEVLVFDPSSAMTDLNNPELTLLSDEIRKKLETVLANLQ
jgi:uncharacterized protein (DUF302 family)